MCFLSLGTNLSLGGSLGSGLGGTGGGVFNKGLLGGLNLAGTQSEFFTILAVTN